MIQQVFMYFNMQNYDLRFPESLKRKRLSH